VARRDRPNPGTEQPPVLALQLQLPLPTTPRHLHTPELAGGLRQALEPTFRQGVKFQLPLTVRAARSGPRPTNESEVRPARPRGTTLRELEIGLPGVQVGPPFERSRRSRPNGLLRRPRSRASSRRDARGCLYLKSGIADRENEPSPLVRTWPAGVPVNTVYSCRTLLTRLSTDADHVGVDQPVCAVQRPDADTRLREQAGPRPLAPRAARGGACGDRRGSPADA
jgi:hypothetical protein